MTHLNSLKAKRNYLKVSLVKSQMARFKKATNARKWAVLNARVQKIQRKHNNVNAAIVFLKRHPNPSMMSVMNLPIGVLRELNANY